MSYELTDLTYLKQQETNKIINFDPSMSASDINSIIRNENNRFIPDGKQIIFQFQDGTYNLDDCLRFVNFYGAAGLITIQGNTSDSTSPNKNQKVILNFTNQYNYGLTLNGLNVHLVTIQFLNIYKQNMNINDSSYNSVIRIFDMSSRIRIYYNYLNIGNKDYGSCIYATNAEIDLQNTMLNYGYYGITMAYSAHCRIKNCPSDNESSYGLRVYNNGNISKNGSPYPTGSIADELIGSGTGNIS